MRATAALTPDRLTATSRFARWLRPLGERGITGIASVIATAAGIYAGLRFLAAVFGHREQILEMLGGGSRLNPYAASGLAALICITMLAVRRVVAWRQLSHQILGPTRRLLRATTAAHHTPIPAFGARYVGVIAMTFGAAVSLDMIAALRDGGGLLPVSGIWRWPTLVVGLVVGGGGLLAFQLSSPYLGKSTRRALTDPRPPVLLLGALDFEPLRETVNLSDDAAYFQSRLGQLVQLLWMVGPVITADMSGRLRDTQGAALVPTTRITHDQVIKTIAASARLTVVVLGRIGALKSDMITAASTGTPMVIFVPRRNRYRVLRRTTADLCLPALAWLDQKLSRGVFCWAISGWVGDWKVRPLAARAEVKSLAAWLNKQMAGFSTVLPRRLRWVGLRLTLRLLKIVGLGLLIMLVALNAWGAVYG